VTCATVYLLLARTSWDSLHCKSKRVTHQKMPLSNFNSCSPRVMFWAQALHQSLHFPHGSVSLGCSGLYLLRTLLVNSHHCWPEAAHKPCHFRDTLTQSPAIIILALVKVAQIFLSPHFSCIQHVDFENWLFAYHLIYPDLNMWIMGDNQQYSLIILCWFSNVFQHVCSWHLCIPVIFRVQLIYTRADLHYSIVHNATQLSLTT